MADLSVSVLLLRTTKKKENEVLYCSSMVIDNNILYIIMLTSFCTVVLDIVLKETVLTMVIDNNDRSYYVDRC